MQVEFTIDELRGLDDALDERYFDDPGGSIETGHNAIKDALIEAEELESIDLNACDGGGCKL